MVSNRSRDVFDRYRRRGNEQLVLLSLALRGSTHTLLALEPCAQHPGVLRRRRRRRPRDGGLDDGGLYRRHPHRRVDRDALGRGLSLSGRLSASPPAPLHVCSQGERGVVLERERKDRRVARTREERRRRQGWQRRCVRRRWWLAYAERETDDINESRARRHWRRWRRRRRRRRRRGRRRPIGRR